MVLFLLAGAVSNILRSCLIIMLPESIEELLFIIHSFTESYYLSFIHLLRAYSVPGTVVVPENTVVQ